MMVFRKNGGQNIIFYFQNPQKAHPCMGPYLLTYFEPKKRTFRSYISCIWGEKSPGRICTKFCTGRNHRCKFGVRSVKPFLRGEGSNFRLFHRLSQSSLQHSRTTVRVCDNNNMVNIERTLMRVYRRTLYVRSQGTFWEQYCNVRTTSCECCHCW